MENVDDVLVLSQDPSMLFFSIAQMVVQVFWMHFTSSKYVMMLQDWIISKPNLVFARDQLDEVDRFSYMGNWIPPGDRISKEMLSGLVKGRLAFSNL